ncbi:CpsD/CapB family tyrosine-protein kinase [Clostridium fallax]|uniref:non-specific protein-tyrosine kinase n=1 Tax=Clostridium fallax TaxID=1533 RepID=A0A1M4WQM4_9CLOT|nr:CpsD/CapB family tyrosine-protein kinase [Clostridium fallax]SHE83591.1 capsular exopolysaccharide family [Clostridium fallax]SQB06280.1 capsular exopolysaccharide family protein [Clostridium fallax]
MSEKVDSIKEIDPFILEAYRELVTNIKFSSFDKKIKTIFITSSIQGEGKTTTALNLAITLAKGGDRVLLIDCDLKRPNIHKKLNISNLTGLSNLILDFEKLDEIINKNIVDNLDVLTSGEKVTNTLELLNSKKMYSLIEKLKDQYDYIILDTPPVGVIADAKVVSQYSDGGLFVVSKDNINRNIAIKAKDMLEKVNANILGVVLTKEIINKDKKSYYGYYEENRKEEGKKRFKFLRR